MLCNKLTRNFKRGSRYAKPSRDAKFPCQLKQAVPLSQNLWRLVSMSKNNYSETEFGSGDLEVLITAEQLQNRIREIGADITRDYLGHRPELICVLKGAMVFMSDLMRAIDLNLSIDFIAVSSYGKGKSSTGEVKIVKDLDGPLEGREIILVEDILDTGLTLSYLANNFRSRGATSIKIATLLNKPERRKVEVTPDYVGFEIPDKFVVGYGLDFAERYRNLPYIGVVKS